MKVSIEFFSRLLIITFITTTLCQPLKSMEYTSAVEEVQDTHRTYNNPDFPIYMLLSSIPYESPFWLPDDITRYITINAHNITKLLFNLALVCSTTRNLLAATYRLNYLYSSCPSMSVALLKIYLNNHKTSLLEIKSDKTGFTVFDCSYAPDSGLEPEVEILCRVVNKKAFVDHFKEPYSVFGFIRKTNLLHRLVWYETNPLIIQLYCGVFMDYAQNCPKKSKEVLNLLKAKDDDRQTVLDIATKKGHIEIAAIFKSTKKQLKRIIQKKENCLIQ